MSKDALKKAIKNVGNQAAFGEALGVTQQAVSYWVNNKLPAEQVIRIEQLSGVSRYELRPDIYGQQTPPETPP